MVAVDVDQWEGFEEGVVDAVCETGVDSCERDGRVLDMNLSRFPDSI